MSTTKCYCSDHEFDVSNANQRSGPWWDEDTILVIFGSRSLGDTLSEEGMEQFIINTIEQHGLDPDCIISGGATGADWGAELAAASLGVPLFVFEVGEPPAWRLQRRDDFGIATGSEVVADWEAEISPVGGPEAYLYRNCAMAEAADIGLAIYDGESSGTQHMMDSCEAHDVSLTVRNFDPRGE